MRRKSGEGFDEASSPYCGEPTGKERKQFAERLERKQRRHDRWGRPIPRWLGRALFSMWMTIFAFVWLFLIPMFVVLMVGRDCWLRFAWFQPWWHGTVYADYAWVVATIAFMGVIIIRPPERTVRQ